MTKKEEVIKAARELFCTYGYKKVSMDEIAKKSKVTKKTIYTYFKDKNDLIKYFAYEEIEKMKQIVDKIEKKNIKTTEKVQSMIYSLLEFKKEEKILTAFAEEEKNIPSGIAQQCSKMFTDSIMKEIEKLLDKSIEKGDVRNCDTRLASFLIYKMYVALMFEWNEPLDKEEVTKNIMNILKIGIFK